MESWEGPTTVLLRNPITQMIFFNQGMLLLGSNHFLISISILCRIHSCQNVPPWFWCSPNNKNNDHSPCWTLPVHIRWSSIVHFLLFLVVLNPFQSSLVFGSTSSGLAVLAIFFCSYVRRFQFLIPAIILGIWSWPRHFSEDTSQDLFPCIRLPRITCLSQLQPFSIWTTHRTTTEPWSRTAENPSVSEFLVWNFFNLKVYSDFV